MQSLDLQDGLLAYLQSFLVEARRGEQDTFFDVELLADHPSDQGFLGGFIPLHGEDVSAVPEHRNPVADAQCFPQLVGDEDDTHPLLDHHPQGLEEGIHLLRGEVGGRLVQDQDFDSSIEGFENLDLLANPHRELFDQGARIDHQPKPFRQVPDPLLFLIEFQGGPILQRSSQYDVLGYCEAIYLKKVLVNHPDAMPDGILGRLNLHPLAV